MSDKSSRAIQVPIPTIHSYDAMLKELHLKKGGWTALFIEYEIRFIRNEDKAYFPLTDNAKTYLNELHEKSETDSFHIGLSKEQRDELNKFCSDYNISKKVFVTAVLSIATLRVRAVSTKKRRVIEIDAIERLRHYFRDKEFRDEHHDWLRENIFFDKYVAPDDFKKKYPDTWK